jgi:hypothetical protein
VELISSPAFDEKSDYGDCTDEANGTETCASIDWEVVTTAEKGDVLQVSYTSDAGHAGIVVGPIDGSWDVSSASSLDFDIKVVNSGSASVFKYKLESDGANSGEIAVAIAGSGDWESISIPASEFNATAFDPATANAFVFLPDYQTGANLVYQIDNVRFVGVGNPISSDDGTGNSGSGDTDNSGSGGSTTLPSQVVAVAGNPAAMVGETLNVDISYDVSDDNANLTGLGLNIHYNSSLITFVALSNVFQGDVIQSAGPYIDADNLDENASTDMYAAVAWAFIGR